MIPQILSWCLWLLILMFGCFQYVFADPILVPYTSSKIRYIGRFAQGSDGARFNFNGAEIRVKIQGATTVTAQLAEFKPKQKFQAHSFLVYIDGVPQTTPIPGSACHYCTFDTHLVQNSSMNNYPIASNLSPSTHEIRIFQSMEPNWNERPYATDDFPDYVTFYSLTLDAGKVLDPDAPSKRRIEFLGDSITAGYCNLCDFKEGRKHPTMASNWSLLEGSGWDEESFALSWPNLICEELKAECHSAAWSGLGMIKNCCGGDVTMPMVWQRTLAADPASVWNFSSWIPDALVINLGTNDGGSAKNPLYTKTYLELVMNASHAYGPDLNVFLACGPMSDGYCPEIENVITNATAAGVKAHFLDQRGFLNGTFGKPCCGHPGTKVDAAMAKAGAKVIGSILNW